MTDLKVCKFGGTSMADGMTIGKVVKIAKSDPRRRFFIVSAPGKRFGGEKKVTDLLLLSHENLKEKGCLGEAFEKVRRRFCLIERELHINLDMGALIEKIEREILKKNREAFTLSRGEYLAAKIAAKALNVPFVDASELFCFSPCGEFCLEESLQRIRNRLQSMKSAVIPGFYGADGEGNIFTFPRGGGDVSGAVVARALDAEIYENWTDVCGFLACDPHITENPARIDKLSFCEMQILSRMGASVLHYDALSPVRDGDIPVMIFNTFRPQDGGTEILPDKCYHPVRPVTGIAGGEDFALLRDENLNLPPAGCECVFWENGKRTYVVREGKLLNFKTDKIKRTALVAVVGQGLKIFPDAPARIFQSISRAGVNILFSFYENAGVEFLIGVEREDFLRCVRALYEEFF